MTTGSSLPLSHKVVPLIVTVGVLVVWELGVRLFNVPRYLLPGFVAVARSAAAEWRALAGGTLATVEVILLGFALAAFTGVPLAFGIVRVTLIEHVVEPVLLLLQIVPKIAIAPLLIVWLGFGLLPNVVMVFLFSLFPITLGAVAGFRSLDPDVTDLARTTGAGGLRSFWLIAAPQALPEIFAGLKVAVALASTGAIVAEFVASDRGIGYLVLQWRGDLDTPLVFAGVAAISAAGIALYHVVAVAERLLLPWHASQRVDTIGGR